jgi:hypothetical protein
VPFFGGIQFFDLMLRKDDEFPGRHDKWMWVGAFFFTFLIGAIICIECGQIIPPDTSVCPACGWSYEATQKFFTPGQCSTCFGKKKAVTSPRTPKGLAQLLSESGDGEG